MKRKGFIWDDGFCLFVWISMAKTKQITRSGLSQRHRIKYRFRCDYWSTHNPLLMIAEMFPFDLRCRYCSVYQIYLIQMNLRIFIDSNSEQNLFFIRSFSRIVRIGMFVELTPAFNFQLNNTIEHWKQSHNFFFPVILSKIFSI